MTRQQFGMSQETYFVEMKEEHIDQATAVLTRSFLQLNDIWKAKAHKYEQIFPIVRAKIIPSIKTSWSFVLLKNNKVIGVSIQYELVQYLKLPSMPTDLHLFKILGETGRNLDKKLDYSKIKPGQVCYGLYGVMDPSQAGKKHAFKFWWNQFAIGKAAGWRYYYSRISSPVSLKLLLRLGAEILADVDVVGSEGKEKMWMIRIDLSKPFPSYNELTNIMTGKSSKPKL